MNPERWNRLKDVLAEAIEAGSAAAHAQLRIACEGDAELLGEAERLLVLHFETGLFLDQRPLLPGLTTKSETRAESAPLP